MTSCSKQDNKMLECTPHNPRVNMLPPVPLTIPPARDQGTVSLALLGMRLKSHICKVGRLQFEFQKDNYSVAEARRAKVLDSGKNM